MPRSPLEIAAKRAAEYIECISPASIVKENIKLGFTNGFKEAHLETLSFYSDMVKIRDLLKFEDTRSMHVKTFDKAIQVLEIVERRISEFEGNNG